MTMMYWIVNSMTSLMTWIGSCFPDAVSYDNEMPGGILDDLAHGMVSLCYGTFPYQWSCDEIRTHRSSFSFASQQFVN